MPFGETLTEREKLLTEIRTGVKLRPTKTNDRSKPMICREKEPGSIQRSASLNRLAPGSNAPGPAEPVSMTRPLLGLGIKSSSHMNLMDVPDQSSSPPMQNGNLLTVPDPSQIVNHHQHQIPVPPPPMMPMGGGMVRCSCDCAEKLKSWLGDYLKDYAKTLEQSICERLEKSMAEKLAEALPQPKPAAAPLENLGPKTERKASVTGTGAAKKYAGPASQPRHLGK